MASKQILTKIYIKKKKKREKYEWYKHDLMTYFASDTDCYFQQARVTNFDITNHECRGTPLQNSEQYYKMVQKKTLAVMKIMFRLRQYHPLLNLKAMIFILNMIFLGEILRKNFILKKIWYLMSFFQKRKKITLILLN